MNSKEQVLQMNNIGHLMVALDETKENRLTPNQLRSLLSEYATAGVALHIWDHDQQAWVRLTKDMLV